MPVAEKDPWIDEHTLVDMTNHAEDKTLIESATDIANERVLDGLPDERGINFVPAEDEPTTRVVEADQPEVIELQDGSTVTIEQTKRGLKATLDPASGAKAEVFYGKDKDELLQSVLIGKLNATKKINELSKRSKINGGQPVPQQPAAGLQKQELTADQKFEIKTAQDAGDLGKAMELTLRYQYGRELTDVVAGSESGQVAKAELDIEGVAKAFRSANPDYYNANENYHAILGWLSSHIQGCPVIAEDGRGVDAAMDFVTSNGYWTVENLQRAYNDLAEDLIPWPVENAEDVEEPPETPAPRRVTPAQPAPASERIARTVRRPRAGLGIRPSSTAGGGRETVNVSAPSVDEIDNLSDAEFDKLYSATIRHARQSSARR